VRSSISGGSYNVSSGWDAPVSGGAANEAFTRAAWVGGGNKNSATGPYSSVSGGEENNANGAIAWIGGGLGNLAEGTFSSIFGGKRPVDGANSLRCACSAPGPAAGEAYCFNMRAQASALSLLGASAQ
jgi:hypothetical protein